MRKNDLDKAIDDWLTREYMGPFEYNVQHSEEEEEDDEDKEQNVYKD